MRAGARGKTPRNMRFVRITMQFYPKGADPAMFLLFKIDQEKDAMRKEKMEWQ